MRTKDSGVCDQIKLDKESVFSVCESNVQSYARAIPAIFTKAEGSIVWDRSGSRYLDFLSGAGALNYGHNNPVMKRALIDYIKADGITHSLDLHTDAKRDFLATLRRVILEPRGLDYVTQFTGPTGTNAVEAALKLARKITGRDCIIHFTNSFHGVSLGSLSITCNKTLRHAGGVSLDHTFCAPFDGYHGDGIDTIAMIERQIDDPSGGLELPAAVILETVQGEGGLNVADRDWLWRLEAFCRRHEILLIVDDIQAGCGRTGTFFSFEPAAITPDIVTLSKSLSGFGLPFSIVLIKREHDRWGPGEHNGTFRGNNHAFVTSEAMLRHYWNTPAFAESIAAKSAYLSTRLNEMVDRFPGLVIEARGCGMMRGIRFADPERARAVAARAFKLGLIIERCGPYDEVVKCMAPLTISMDELTTGLDILQNALSEETASGADEAISDTIVSAA